MGIQMAVVLFSSELESANATDAFEETDRGQHLATVAFHSERFPLGAWKSSGPFNRRKENMFLNFISGSESLRSFTKLAESMDMGPFLGKLIAAYLL
jgi:hypothetical protein